MSVIERINKAIKHYKQLKDYHYKVSRDVAASSVASGCAGVVEELEKIRAAVLLEVADFRAGVNEAKKRADTHEAAAEHKANELIVARAEYRRAMDELKSKLDSANAEVYRLKYERGYWNDLAESAVEEVRRLRGDLKVSVDLAEPSEAAKKIQEAVNAEMDKVASRMIGVPKADDLEKALGTTFWKSTPLNSVAEKWGMEQKPTSADTFTVRFVTDPDEHIATIADVKRLISERFGEELKKYARLTDS